MEILKKLLLVTIIIIPVLIAVAFFTVAKRKIMGVKKKRNITICTYYLIIFVVLSGLWACYLNYVSIDFVLKLNFLIFSLVAVLFSGLFFYKFLFLFPFSEKFNLNLTKLFYQFRDEILDLKISNKTLFFSLFNFIVFLILIYNGFLKLSFIFIVLSCFLLIKELKTVKTWIKESNEDYIKLTLLYKNEYTFVYYFSHLIKFIFIIYTCYFCSWILFLQPTFFLNEISSFESYFSHVQNSYHNLYFLLVLFLNSALFDFTMESIIIYNNYELFLQFSPGSFLRRATRLAAFTTGGGVTAGVGIAYSPAVDIPGVNLFQIYLGRGYGYETSLDWGKGMILQSYLKKEVMLELVEKHGNKGKILDGNFFVDVMNKENLVVQTLNKRCTAMEQRALGLRKF